MGILELMKKYANLVLIIILFGIISALATYFAVSHGYFVLNWDGYIHLTRFEDVYLSLKNGDLPPLVNLVGFGNAGHAFNSMYPWITALILILPRFLFANPILALAVGMFVVNFLTVINTYILVRELTNRILLRLLGCVLYVFSTYHFILLYTRVALGEALAYTFLPLVLAGCIRIWNKTYKYSYSFIGLGVGMIVNSHLISAAMIIILIIGTEIIRLLLKKVTFLEVITFCKAMILSILVGLYSIVNVLFMEFNNNFFEIAHGLSTVSAMDMLTTSLNNTIQEQNSAFNMGIINIILVIFVTIFCLYKKETKSRVYVYSLLIMIFIIFGWISVDFLKNTFLSNIQFLGRLLGLISLFIVISLIIQLEESKFKVNSVIYFLMFIVVIFNISALRNYHRDYGNDSSSTLIQINKKNYMDSTVYKGMRLRDYVPKNVANNIFDGKYHSLEVKKESYDELSGIVNVRKNGIYTINFAVCGGVPYKFKVNGKKVSNNGENGELKLALNAGENVVSITTRTPKFCYVTFGITCITMLVISVFLLKSCWNFKVKTMLRRT